MPTFVALGDTLTSMLSAISMDSLTGNPIYSATDTLEQILLCAYDPNDKIAEPNGIDTLYYIHQNTPYIDYTVRFQNTGNDTAITVVIKDQLDMDLDWQSLTYLSSSDSVDIVLFPSGEIVFSFVNIMLPDSNIDKLGSQGYVKFRVKLNSNLTAGTTIENTAHIYFDQNPAVITNTKTHTIYDCNAPLSIYLSENSICLGDTILAFGSDNISSTLFNWDIDGFYTYNGDTLLWIADTSGTFNLTVNTSNALCNKFNNTQVTILPEILQFIDSVTICPGDSALLFGMYQTLPGTYFDTLQAASSCDSIISKELVFRTLPIITLSSFNPDTLCETDNSVALPSATPSGGIYSGNGVVGNNFDPSIAGLGTHYVYYTFTDSNSCISVDSSSILVESCVGIEEFANQVITVYPNPFNGFTTLHFDASHKGIFDISLYDMVGKLVFTEPQVNRQKVNVGPLEKGVYLLTLINNKTGEKVTRKLISQ